MCSQLSDRRFLTKKVIARRNGVHTGTIDRWVRQGHYPKPIKVSKKGGCRWLETAVTAWEQAREGESLTNPTVSTERVTP